MAVALSPSPSSSPSRKSPFAAAAAMIKTPSRDRSCSRRQRAHDPPQRDAPPLEQSRHRQHQRTYLPMEPPETCDFKTSKKPEQPALEPPEVILDREEDERRAAADGGGGGVGSDGHDDDEDEDDDPEERTRLTRTRLSKPPRRSDASDSSHGDVSIILDGMEGSAPIQSSATSSSAADAVAASKASLQALHVIPRRDGRRGPANSAAGGTVDGDDTFHSRTGSNDGGDTLGLGSMLNGDSRNYGGEAATATSNLGDMSGALIVLSGAREASFENLNFKEVQRQQQRKNKNSKQTSNQRQIGNEGQTPPEEPGQSQSLVVYQQTEPQARSLPRSTPPSRSARQRNKAAAAYCSNSHTSGTSGAGASHLSGHSAALSADCHSIRTKSPPDLRPLPPSHISMSRERILDRKDKKGQLESFLTKRTSCGTELSETSRDRRHRGGRSGVGDADLSVDANANVKGSASFSASDEIVGTTRRRTGRSTSRVRNRSVGPNAASSAARSTPAARARSKSRPRMKSIKSNDVSQDSIAATSEAPSVDLDHPDRIRKAGTVKTALHRSISSPVQETNFAGRRLSPPNSKLASAPSSGNHGRGDGHDFSAEKGHRRTYSRSNTTASSESSRESSTILRNSCLSLNHPPPPPPPLKRSDMKSTRSSQDDLSNSQVHNNDNSYIGLASKHKEFKDCEVAVAAAPSFNQSQKTQVPTSSMSKSTRTKLEDPTNPADGSEATGGTESTYPSTSYERGNGSGGYGDSGMGSAMMDYHGNNRNYEAATPRGIRESTSNVSGSGSSSVRDRNNIGVRQASERSTPPPPPPSAVPGPPSSARSYRHDDSINNVSKNQSAIHRHPPPPSATANPAANPSAQTKGKYKTFHFEDLSESRLSEARRQGVNISHGRGTSKTVCDDWGRESGDGRAAARTSDRYARSASAARMRRAQSAGRRRASVNDDVEWQRQQVRGYRQFDDSDGRNRERDWDRARDRDRDRDRDRERNRDNGNHYQSVTSLSRSKDQIHPPPPQHQYQRGPSRSRASSRPPPPASARARSPEPQRSRTPSRHQRDYGHDDSRRFNDQRYDDGRHHDDRSYHDRDRQYHPPPPQEPQDRRYHHHEGVKNGNINNNHHNYHPPNNPPAGKEIPKRDLLRHPSMHDDQPTPGANEINLVIDEHGHGSFTCSNKQFDIQIEESTRRYVIRTQMGKLSKIRETHPQTNILRTLSYWNDLQKKRYSRDGHGIGGQLAIDSQNKNQVIMTLMGEYTRAEWEYDEWFQRELERFVEDALQFHMCLNGETEDDIANGKGKKKSSKKKKGGDGVLSKVFQKAINRDNK
ncbi:hypothetical protein ACHAXS_012747 [Conticribra weissflogii]